MQLPYALGKVGQDYIFADQSLLVVKAAGASRAPAADTQKLTAPARAAAGVAFQAGAVANKCEVLALVARFAFVAA